MPQQIKLTEIVNLPKKNKTKKQFLLMFLDQRWLTSM